MLAKDVFAQFAPEIDDSFSIVLAGNEITHWMIEPFDKENEIGITKLFSLVLKKDASLFAVFD